MAGPTSRFASARRRVPRIPCELTGDGRHVVPYSLNGTGRAAVSDAHAELLLRDVRHVLRRPWRVPHDLDLRLLHAGERLELPLHVLVDVAGCGAAGGSERHADRD